MNLAVIPARGGSRRIPRKNCRLFHGKPIIVYSIEAAQASGLFHEIVVSTDDEEIAEIAAANKASVYWRREPHDEGVGTQGRVQEVLSVWNGDYEHACCVYATAPMMDASDLAFGLAMLKCVGIYRYVYVPGWYYWGRSFDFLMRTQIQPSDSLCLTPDPARWIDINHESDWKLAEKMFAARKEMA